MSGSVSCRWVTAGPGTSNASTTMSGEDEAGFLRPVASMVSVCEVAAKPESVNMVTRISSVSWDVSTSAANVPSRYTFAMPVAALRPPIQVTDGPVNVNVARAPGVADNAAVPPLQGLLLSPSVQPAV